MDNQQRSLALAKNVQRLFRSGSRDQAILKQRTTRILVEDIVSSLWKHKGNIDLFHNKVAIYYKDNVSTVYGLAMLNPMLLVKGKVTDLA